MSDVQEIDGKIIHYTDGPLVEGTEVEGCIDWTERFSKNAAAYWGAYCFGADS